MVKLMQNYDFLKIQKNISRPFMSDVRQIHTIDRNIGTAFHCYTDDYGSLSNYD